MRNIDEDTITQAVIARHAQAPDARLRDVMTSLVQHLHAFAREVQLTEDEWFAGIRFLTETGQACNDRRQEFALLSDTLGLSMLVTAMNHRPAKGCTASTGLGPFTFDAAPAFPSGDDRARDASGEPCFVQGHVRGPGGEPVPAADVQVWQAGGDGGCDGPIQTHRAGARLQTDAEGAFHIRTTVARAHPVPTDGPAGRMLQALGRPAWRPAHLHVQVAAPGYRRLSTQVFRSDDPHLDSDAVFGVRRALIADWVRHDAGRAPDGSVCDTPFTTLAFDFVLERA
jgi:hydroxyquinol 1,2-dioxygenase